MRMKLPRMHKVALTRRSDVISDRPTPLAEFEVLLRVHSRWPLSSICYGHMHTHPRREERGKKTRANFFASELIATDVLI